MEVILIERAERPADTEHYTVMATSQDDRPAWIAERNAYLGASEVPILMGAVSPAWGSPVALQAKKMGLAVDDNDDWGPMLRWGLKMEPLILTEYGAEAGLPVESFGYTLRSKQWPWLGCTPDGVEAPTGRFVQAKNAAGFQRWEQYDNGVIEPRRVWVQVQAEMAVTGATECIVVALVRGFDLRWALVPRDDTFIDEQMIPACQTFMQSIEDEEMLPMDFTESCTDALSLMYPEAEIKKTILLPSSFQDLDERYVELAAEGKLVKRKQDVIKNIVRSKMGDCALGNVTNGAYWRWGNTKNGGRTLRRYKGKSEPKKETEDGT